MGKINGCIKCLFIYFNVVFALLACVLIYLAVDDTGFSRQFTAVGAPSLVWILVFAPCVVVLSVFGIVAACMEKQLLFKIFAGFMVAGMIIMLIFGILVVVSRNTLKDSYDTASPEAAKPFMEEEAMRLLLMQLEERGHCCGVVSSSDWGNDIPQSCECKDQYTGFSISTGCKPKPVGASGPDEIYATSCSNVLFAILDIIFQIFMGFYFTFAVLALLGLLMSILMIHQIRKHDSGGSSMAMKTY
ncbi:23 kDa integral membrane protein-like [Trematomus bernacchii]|uniref:23 kDa integral membrane protein-like n=1 Tax=Trematomus bernacchii TaxID=40690 RepID=UPI00146D61A9|nr:23 kDa integral membrane protein-like [Trematomus bernacchii]